MKCQVCGAIGWYVPKMGDILCWDCVWRYAHLDIRGGG